MRKTHAKFDFDVAIVGGGSAGYAAARTTAVSGLKTVVIEGGEEVGGLCILRGCMPTKALLYAAEVMHLANHADTWGIHVSKVGFDFSKVMARKHVLIKEFADYRRAQLDTGKFKFIRADAKFLDKHTLELSSADTTGRDKPRERPGLRQSSAALARAVAQGKAPEDWRAPKPDGRLLTARHFIITTGSIVAQPPLPQLETVATSPATMRSHSSACPNHSSYSAAARSQSSSRNSSHALASRSHSSNAANTFSANSTRTPRP